MGKKIMSDKYLHDFCYAIPQSHFLKPLMALKVIAYPIQISVHEAAGRFSAGFPVDRMLAFSPPKTLSEILLFLSREKSERQGQVLNHNFEISQGLLSIQYTSDFF